MRESRKVCLQLAKEFHGQPKNLIYSDSLADILITQKLYGTESSFEKMLAEMNFP